MRQRNTAPLRRPFVVTVTAFTAAAAACGGTVGTGETSSTAESGGTTGTSGSGTGGTGASTGGSTGAGANPPGFGGSNFGGSGGTAGSYGTGGVSVGGSYGAGGSYGTGGWVADSSNPPPVCPAEPSSYGTCTPGFGYCSYDVECQSGPQRFDFTCGVSTLTLLGRDCTHPYDSCPGTWLNCLNGTWVMNDFGNPPAPCPATRPADGSPCNPGGSFGLDPDHCGYRCYPDAGSAWTIVSCSAAPDGGPGSWQDDGACDVVDAGMPGD